MNLLLKQMSMKKVSFCLASAWPGIMRTLYGEPERHQNGYYTQRPGYFFTGDGAYKDEDGYFWITGRIDDVVNISGHRLGTVEIEDAFTFSSGNCRSRCCWLST